MLSNGCATFEYDSANRLLKAGGHTYTYNAEDVRIRNLCGDADTTYTYNTNCKLSQLLTKTTNGITTKYVYGNGLIGEEKCGEFKTYHFDFRGSTVAITNQYGNVTDTFKYDTYGNVTEHIGNSFVIFGYNGRDGVVTDKNGLIYMRARYYSPQMRRFVNADIIHGQISDSTSLNRYSYVNGNPVSFVDPFGLAPERGDNSNNWVHKIKELFGWSVDEFKRLTAEGKLDWFLELTLGAKKYENNIYHIRQDWLQSWHFVGYNDIYDWAFDVGVGMTGGTVDKIKFPFKTEDGDEYIIWAWKGDYINLGSGAEAGIYEESVIPGYWLTSTDNNLKISLSLKEIDSGDVLFSYTPTQPQWWINGFDPSNQDAKAENLISTVTIDFSNNDELFEGFYGTYGSTSKEKLWEFDGKVATLVW